MGATLGSFMGVQLASWLGRQRSYLLVGLSATILTIAMFRCTAPLHPATLPVYFRSLPVLDSNSCRKSHCFFENQK